MFLHTEVEKTYKFLTGWYFDPIVVVPPVMFIVWVVVRIADPDAIAGVFAALVALSPLWLPVMLAIVFWKRWIHYVRFAYWFSQKHVLLHIELPPEVEKSPAAMELLLVSLHNSSGEGTFIQRYWKGQFMPISSLELISDGGRIGYYLYLREGMKDATEARIYGQFPEARVTKVEDYVSKIKFNTTDYGLWGCEYRKTDKVHAVPIKTYQDFELDKNTDVPETKIDPLTNIFEFLGNLGPGERLWVQIIIHARKGDQWYGIYKAGGDKRFQKEGGDKIKEITKEAIKRAQDIIGADKPDAQGRAAERGTGQLTQGERDFVTAIENNMGKPVFECGIRAIYIADNGKFNGTRPSNIAQLWAPFKGGNGLAPTRGQALFNYPWQDWNGIRASLIKKQLFFWYKHRAYFYGTPLEQDPVMLTTQELATMWHFPGSQVKTPALQRVPSRVSEAPLNLPVATGPNNLPQ